MDKVIQKKINNNNRKRGGAFEKKVAEILNMDVVPYSGTNARFGWGDVRDTVWLGECKNITPKDNKVTLKIEWFSKNNNRADNINRIPYLAWMPAGKADKYVVLDHTTYSMLTNKYKVVLPYYSSYELKYVTGMKNLIIDLNADYIKPIRDNKVVEISMNGLYWYMMSIQKFRSVIDNNPLIKGVKSEFN